MLCTGASATRPAPLAMSFQILLRSSDLKMASRTRLSPRIWWGGAFLSSFGLFWPKCGLVGP